MNQLNQTKTNKEQYFQEMQETWKQTREYMLQKLSTWKEINKKAVLSLLKNPVIKKRIFTDRPKVRPFLMRLSFEVCGGGNWKRIIPACGAVEFLNISTYVINAVFDEKGEEQSQKDINQYIITGMLLRDLAAECLLETPISLSPEETREIMRLLMEINKQGYFGQHIDLYQLKKENRDSFQSFEEMKELYFSRTEKFCGYFMSNIAHIGAILSNARHDQIKTLKNYGFYYGTGIQIANDLGDFVFGKTIDYEKVYQDQYSDIKHGKLTFPIICGLEMSQKNKIASLLGKKQASDKTWKALTSYLIESGIFEKTKKLCLQKYRECKKESKKLAKSKARDYLSLMASILRSNKYFAFLSRLEKEIEKKKNHENAF